MVSLRNVGRAPDSDSSVAIKSWADTANVPYVVTTTLVNNQIGAEIGNQNPQGQAYVDAHDALRATKVAVDAADTNYVATTVLNVVNGVAGLDSSGNLFTAQTPTASITDRTATSYIASGGGILLGSGTTHQCSTTGVREFKLATITVADPGWPWIPLPVAEVMGWSLGTAPDNGSRSTGTGILGQLTVTPPSGVSDVIYGKGLCTGVYNQSDVYTVVPYGALNMTPATQSAVSGSLTLDLYGSCAVGTPYVFSGTDLSFRVLVMPAAT